MSFTGRFEIQEKHRPRKREGIALLLAVCFTLIGVMGFAQTSKAAPVTVKFDHGRLSFGAILKDQTILPASGKFPSDSLPTPQRTDIELNGDETGGVLSFPAASNTGLQFPYMGMENPLDPEITIPVTFRLNEPGLTGTFDPATGAATLAGSIDIIVITGSGTTFPLPDSLDDAGVPSLGLFARCRMSDVPVSFSTSGTLPYAGQDFDGGFGVDGSLSTSWKTPTAAVSENGGDCDSVDLVTRGYGGIWLSNGVAETEFTTLPPPTCAEDPRVCPESEPEADISKLRLRAVHRKLKAGKKGFVRVKVSNSGDADSGRITVKLRSSNKRVKIARRIRLKVPANSTKTRRIAVKARARARGKAVIRATTEGKKATARFKIKARK